MSAAQAALRGQRLAERQMTSTVRFFTEGDPVTDPETGEVSPSEVDPVTCPARVRPMSMRDYPALAGGEQVFAANFVVSVPFSQEPIPRVKQRVVVVSSPDPALVGMAMQVRDVAAGDQISARRLLCYRVA